MGFASAAALIAALASLVGHQGPATKTVSVRQAGPWPELLVTFTARRGEDLRRLVGLRGGERASAEQARRLEAVVVERATFALRLVVDGVVMPTPFEVEASTGTYAGEGRLAVALRGRGAWPLFCGWHHLGISDRVPGGALIQLGWPDGQHEHLTSGHHSARWLWLCDAPADAWRR